MLVQAATSSTRHTSYYKKRICKLPLAWAVPKFCGNHRTSQKPPKQSPTCTKTPNFENWSIHTVSWSISSTGEVLFPAETPLAWTNRYFGLQNLQTICRAELLYPIVTSQEQSYHQFPQLHTSKFPLEDHLSSAHLHVQTAQETAQWEQDILVEMAQLGLDLCGLCRLGQENNRSKNPGCR